MTLFLSVDFTIIKNEALLDLSSLIVQGNYLLQTWVFDLTPFIIWKVITNMGDSVINEKKSYPEINEDKDVIYMQVLCLKIREKQIMEPFTAQFQNHLGKHFILSMIMVNTRMSSLRDLRK